MASACAGTRLKDMAETYTAPGFYTITYPDELTLDNTSYADENSEDEIWLFLLSNDDYMLDAYITKLDEYANVSLYSATDAQREAYVADTLDDYADYQAQLVETVTTEEGVPFYVFSMQPAASRSLCARPAFTPRSSRYLAAKP